MKRSLIDSRSGSEKIIFGVVFVFLALYALSFLAPFLWILVQSFKTSDEFYSGSRLAFPTKWVLSNYDYALFRMTYNKTNFVGMFLNNVLLATEFTAAMVIFPTMTAYVVAKYPFRFCKILFGVAIAVQVIPTIGTLPSTFRLISTLQMKNNLGTLWIMAASGFGFNFIVLHSGFRSISWQYAEAGKMDGAGNFRIFLQIMLPQAKPFIISVAITTFITNWNDYLTSFLYMPKKPTLSLGLYELGQKLLYDSGNITPLFAGILLSVLPTVVLFGGFQKLIMENTSAGGIKG